MKSKLIQIATYTIASSALLLSSQIANAIPIKDVLNPQQHNGTWVSDTADILSNTTEAKLNKIINELEKSKGVEIAVVTVDNTASATNPKAYATELFNYWGIGKAEQNNGVLFLISVGDRRVEIETGLGIEPILSNAEVKQIIDRQITPQFKQKNFDRGTLEGTQALINALDNSNANKIPFGWIAVFIAAGTSVIGIIKFRQHSNRIYIDPELTNYRLNRDDSRTICCAKCSKPMKRVEKIQLNKAQKVAKRIGSTSYRGYQCSDCIQATNSVVKVAYMSTSSRYDNCPQCKELTVIRTEETTKQPSYKQLGKKVIKRECNCCDYVRETTFDIPCLRQNRSYSSNRSSRSSNSYGNYYSGGGSYGGGGSSGGGFGGGSSDGGGAGGDW